MNKLNNKFAIGCLIQWYEIELVEEYLQSVKNAVDMIDNKKNVIIDLYFNSSQALEKIDENQMTISEIRRHFEQRRARDAKRLEAIKKLKKSRF